MTIFEIQSLRLDIIELKGNRVRMMIKLAANPTGDEGLFRQTRKSYGRFHGLAVRTSLPPIQCYGDALFSLISQLYICYGEISVIIYFLGLSTIFKKQITVDITV